MDGALKRKFRTSNLTDRCLIHLQKYCHFSNQIFKIPIIHKPLCKFANCHNNVSHYVKTYGGERVVGYYLITDLYDDNYGCAIYHSIWKNTFGVMVDITPFEDNREYNIFTICNNKQYYSGIVYDGNDCFEYEFADFQL